MTKRQPDDVVSASEIASWAWCPEAWRLGQGLGLRPGNEERLEAGERIHARTAAIERHSGAAQRVGLVLLALGMVGLGLGLYALVGR